MAHALVHALATNRWQCGTFECDADCSKTTTTTTITTTTTAAADATVSRETATTSDTTEKSSTTSSPSSSSSSPVSPSQTPPSDLASFAAFRAAATQNVSLVDDDEPAPFARTTDAPRTAVVAVDDAPTPSASSVAAASAAVAATAATAAPAAAVSAGATTIDAAAVVPARSASVKKSHESIFRSLAGRIRGLELNLSLLESYVQKVMDQLRGELRDARARIDADAARRSNATARAVAARDAAERAAATFDRAALRAELAAAAADERAALVARIDALAERLAAADQTRRVELVAHTLAGVLLSLLLVGAAHCCLALARERRQALRPPAVDRLVKVSPATPHRSFAAVKRELLDSHAPTTPAAPSPSVPRQIKQEKRSTP
eukprot:TRINITY_DN1187_c0_g4_i1.p1 TRINITY_DN1187_c0_g4~~TRINITY_DN1187_c0_g4_i1.p1  ORF type:complete len:379 (+),score=200.38 TRINITY_DN1187_c0_g4_i1:474-1610(+)